MCASDLACLFDAVEPIERACRLRELRAIARLQLGAAHPLTAALGCAIADAGQIDAALAEIDGLAALPRRRLLCTWAAVLPAGA